MSISRAGSVWKPFVLKERDLRRFDAAFREFGGDPAYEAACTDGLTRKFTSLEEFLEFDNPPATALSKLTILTRSADHKRSAHLVLSVKNYDPVSIYLDGDDDSIIKINAKIENQLESMRPWYSRFVKLDFSLILPFLLIALILGIVVLVGFGVIDPDSSGSALKDPREAWRSAMVWIVLALVSIGAGALLNRLRTWLFPVGFFAVGQGVERFELKEKIRWVVVVGLLVSIIGSLVASTL